MMELSEKKLKTVIIKFVISTTIYNLCVNKKENIKIHKEIKVIKNKPIKVMELKEGENENSPDAVNIRLVIKEDRHNELVERTKEQQNSHRSRENTIVLKKRANIYIVRVPEGEQNEHRLTDYLKK